MSDRPIVLTADEVRETLTGRMSHILRPVNPQPLIGNSGVWYPKAPLQPFGRGRERHYAHEEHMRRGLHIDFGPCASGDRLWVRETWGVGSRPDPFTGCRDGVEYRADEGLLQEGEALPLRSVEPPTGVDLDGIRPGWHSSTSMPRWASRLSLDVVAVRVQRLQEVTEEQAQAAGVPRSEPPIIGYATPPAMCVRDDAPLWADSAADALNFWWDHRHRDRAPASSNPWIWEITVKRVED